MFGFLPHVKLETNTNQHHIDDLFIMNVKPDSNLAERESMRKKGLELAKDDITRVIKLILLSKKTLQKKETKRRQTRFW
jgi:hypothetical protein